ncbi:MAG: acetate--CoA ligase family protein [Dissulfurispiraceae bacterium]
MLDCLFKPSSIAIIGASNDYKKVGSVVLSNLQKYSFKGNIYPINPSATEVLGVKAYSQASNIGSPIDLAVIAIPAKYVPDALIDCSHAGVGVAVILSAGFKEAGHEGIKLENEIKKISLDNGIRLLGPNCLGVINTSNNMNATFAGEMLPKGRTAFFSQSGALGIAILDWALGNQMGFSKFISLGNKTDLNETDFIEYFVSDEETDIILGYIEDVIDGKKFMEVARRATKIKPVILIKAGGTEAGARAASSHTGALAGSEIAFNSAFTQTGVIHAKGIQDLFDCAMAFSGRKLPQGNRLLIVTNAGGPGILAADMSERLGLMLPPMTAENIDFISSRLPSNASLYNPVDIIGDATSERYATVLSRAINDPHIEGILVILTPQAMTDVENTADIVIEETTHTEKPIITSFIGDMKVRKSIEKLKSRGVPSFSYPELAVTAFKRLVDYRLWKDSQEIDAPTHVSNKEPAGKIITELLTSGRYEIGEDTSMKILSHYGFTFPERALVRSATEASAIAERIGFPIAMKIASPDILHKTDVGGVRLNINTLAATENAFIEITTNVKRFMPDAFITGVMIYEMIQGGKEVVLGINYDRSFGHMIMFGLGGIYIEVLKDVSFRIAPVTRSEALAMVHEIKASALLKGVRGEKPADVEAVVDGIQNLSALVTDFPMIHELDVNPFMVMNRGAFALDARIILKSQ